MMPSRPWTASVARLKTRAADARDVPAKLRAVLEDALSTCDGLLLHLGEAELEVERLRRRAANQAAAHEHLFHEMPIACVVVDLAGRILLANAHAAALLNVSARRLPDRLLMHFVDNREAFQQMLDRLTPHAPVRGVLTVRPRERARVEVAMHVLPARRADEAVGLCFLMPRHRPPVRIVPEPREAVGEAAPTISSDAASLISRKPA